jgi:hypothetical protein
MEEREATTVDAAEVLAFGGRTGVNDPQRPHVVVSVRFFSK